MGTNSLLLRKPAELQRSTIQMAANHFELQFNRRALGLGRRRGAHKLKRRQHQAHQSNAEKTEEQGHCRAELLVIDETLENLPDVASLILVKARDIRLRGIAQLGNGRTQLTIDLGDGTQQKRGKSTLNNQQKNDE